MAYEPWKIHHCDLGETCVLPELEDGYQGILLICWWKHTPLGQVRKTRTEWTEFKESFPESAISYLAHAVGHYYLKTVPGLGALNSENRPSLATILGDSGPANPPETKTPGASVIVCTRNRPDQLRKCLQSIRNLVHVPAQVIVVDNAPGANGTRRVVEEFAGVVYVPEPTPGLSVARNVGLNHCHTDFVAFTDDDVVVHPQWLGQIEKAFADPEVMIVTGLVIPHSLDTQAEYTFESEWGFSRGFVPLVFDKAYFNRSKDTELTVWEIGAGANMAARTDLFRQVGNFDERLGAGAAGCSEDSELWYRVLAGGHTCRYEPKVVVFHHHRSDMRQLRKQIQAYMRGHVVALLIQHARHHHKANLRRLCIQLPLHTLRKIASRKFWTKLLSDENTFLPEWTGILTGVTYYFKHGNRKNKHVYAPPVYADKPLTEIDDHA